MNTTKRKKYVREMNASWWQQLPFYKLYIAREATSIPSLWFSLVLLYGAYCLQNGLTAFNTDFISFLQNPVVIGLNIVAFFAALLNTVTYYVMTPKVLNIIVKNERLKSSWLTAGLWIVTIVVSLLILGAMYV